MKCLFSIISECKNHDRHVAKKEWGIFEPTGLNLAAYGRAMQTNEWERNEQLQATVLSDYDLEFFALDHNKQYEATIPAEQPRCDGFIFSDDRVVQVFVELKNRKTSTPSEAMDIIAEQCIDVDARSMIAEKDREEWLPKAVVQLSSTIESFKLSDPAEYALSGSIKRAYVANRRVGYNIEFMAENTKAKFLGSTGYVLYINTRIKIDKIPPVIKLRLFHGDQLKALTT